MSWSVGVTSVPKEELKSALDERFEQNYSEPASGVSEQFDAAKAAVDAALDVLSEGSSYSVSLSGHAKQGDDDWGSSLSISVTSNK